MKKRCKWANQEPLIAYHDTEWGRPQHDDLKLFEFLLLEGAQAGLSWITILKRRNGYRNAFSNFSPSVIAEFNATDVSRLMQNNSIIRNERKILSAINNAKQFLKIQKEFGSFDNYLWEFTKHSTVLNNFETLHDIPSYTPVSEKMSASLKKYGFTFVGPTICYAFMQAIGMVNDHTVDCYLYHKNF